MAGNRKLSNWLESYLEMVSETEPPLRFHIWVAITILGAMLGRKSIIQLGPELIFPNLYTILVGPPGIRKSRAIHYGVSLLQGMRGVVLAPDVVTKQQFYAELEAAQEVVDMDGKKYVHSSLFIVASELIVFMRKQDEERLGDLCKLYDGEPSFQYKTKTSGSNYIMNPGLWILGATTPDWIELSMRYLGLGGGIARRILFVYAAKKARHVPMTRMKPFDERLRSALVHDLGQIRRLSGTFRFEPEAEEVFANWYESDYVRDRPVNPRITGFWDTLPTLVVKVAMILSAARSDDRIIRSEHLEEAIGLLNHIQPDMPLAFGALGQSPTAKQAELVRTVVRTQKQVSKSTILQTLRHDLSEWDYARVRDTLLSERFCTRVIRDGEEWLIYVGGGDG